MSIESVEVLRSKNGTVPSADVKPVSVVQVTWSLAAGGSERYTVDVASGLDRERYTPFICALDKGGAFESDADSRGIPYTLMSRTPGLSPRLIWRIYQIFRSRRAKIVHTHHFPSLLYSLIGAKLVGARLIHTEHGLSTYNVWHRRFALRVMSQFCHAVVAVGVDSERFLRQQVGVEASKLFVIPGGVRADRFRNVSRADARRDLGLKESDRVIVMVARLSPEKNHVLLLDAFEEVRKRIPEARLLIVGGGPEQAAIVERIGRLGLAGCVNMLGVRHDIPQVLSASDVFVLTSDREALPIAVLEAMAAGLPIVATNVGDLYTVIEDGINGRLIPPGDVEGFANATISLLQNPELSTLMGRNNRFRANEFTVSTTVEKYERIYAS